ncbi:MAG: GntR family transcriptional regulator [Proteobacteria bacterium]|nr:GntR family transcriptional regulator [Pseudomonadota bacterium]
MPTLPIQLSQSSWEPIYRQIEDQIARLIRSGEAQPSQLLPSVRQLSEQLGVSAITIRRAYDDLTREGLLVRRQGQGTFVARDIATTLRARSLREAEDVVSRALIEARQMGLKGSALRAAVEALLEGDETDS